jgi:hypothetical protein
VTDRLGARVVLAGTGLYLFLSILNWQNPCVAGICSGVQEWNGIGLAAGLCALALLVWEILRWRGAARSLVRLEPPLVSVVLATGLLVLTVLTFREHEESQTWVPWTALIVSMVIAAVTLARVAGDGLRGLKRGP